MEVGNRPHVGICEMLFLTGQYFHAIDAKSRLTIPAKLRDAINRKEETYRFYAVPLFDKVLYLYTPQTYEQIAPQFEPKLDANADVRDFKRLRFGLAEQLEIDRLGRVLIPDSMAKRCSLTKDVAIIGVQDHIEVWDRARWEAHMSQQLDRQEELAARAMGLQDGSKEPEAPKTD